MGSIGLDKASDQYSVPEEALKVLQTDILANPLVSKNLVEGTSDFIGRVRFTGNDKPSIPVNWRFAESAAALKGLEACIVAELVKRKYGVNLEGASINTDHASLFFMSCMIWQAVPPDTGPGGFAGTVASRAKIADRDIYKYIVTSPYRASATNIYRTKDDRWFHIHGSINSTPTIESLGLPDDQPELNREESVAIFEKRMSEINSDEMQHVASDIYKQAGVICNTVEQFRQTEHGKSNAHTSASRPLAGLKVVDLCRIIAGPTITRGLAELGASVLRVTSPNLPDLHQLHMDLNWGKWNCNLDLKKPEDLERLKNLIKEADVVVQGYRPFILDKYGLSVDGIIDLVKNRERGIISVRENCYGWNGPWVSRSGWQQISDACVGISAGFGKAMGLEDDEAVTPVFPNSDYMTGVVGVCGIMTALMRQAEKGGSWKVDLALNYYNQWLADSIGEYPEGVWQDVWNRNGRVVSRHYDNMPVTGPRFAKMLKENSNEVVFNPKFFEERESKAINIKASMVKPIISFEKNEVSLGFNVGTRGDGLDAAKWPEDLMTEIIT